MVQIITNCDVSSDQDVDRTSNEFKEIYGTCDFIIHAVAFANREDLEGDFSNVSREGWNKAYECHSFVSIANKFKSIQMKMHR